MPTDGVFTRQNTQAEWPINGPSIQMGEMYLNPAVYFSGSDSPEPPRLTTGTLKALKPQLTSQEERIAELERKYKALEFMVEHLMKEPPTQSTVFRD